LRMRAPLHARDPEVRGHITTFRAFDAVDPRKPAAPAAGGQEMVIVLRAPQPNKTPSASLKLRRKGPARAKVARPSGEPHACTRPRTRTSNETTGRSRSFAWRALPHPSLARHPSQVERKCECRVYRNLADADVGERRDHEQRTKWVDTAHLQHQRKTTMLSWGARAIILALARAKRASSRLGQRPNGGDMTRR